MEQDFKLERERMDVNQLRDGGRMIVPVGKTHEVQNTGCQG